MADRRLVILDKNFLQSEDRTTPRLRALAKCGCEFVLTDTLIYELCSDSRLPNLWRSVRRKLSPFANRVKVWFHTSDLLRQEIACNAPVESPEDVEATDHLRHSITCGELGEPANLSSIVSKAHQQREGDTVQAVVLMARDLGRKIIKTGEEMGLEKMSKADLAGHVLRSLHDANLMKWALRRCHGDLDSENHIPEPETRITSAWFAFHSAQAMMALAGKFLQKYGLGDDPGKKFPNTKLDMDYLALLHYADAIASDETTGDMSEMCEALYGQTKKRITSARLRSTIPSEATVHLGAYLRWDSTGRTHGHDVDDWLQTETELYDSLWNQL